MYSHIFGGRTNICYNTHAQLFFGGDELTCFNQSEAKKLSQIHTNTESTYCQALLYEQRLQKEGMIGEGRDWRIIRD